LLNKRPNSNHLITREKKENMSISAVQKRLHGYVGMSIGRRHEVVALQQLHLTAVFWLEPTAAEDPAHADDHHGVVLHAKRDDAPLAITGPDA
jgi:hypothetical protein